MQTHSTFVLGTLKYLDMMYLNMKILFKKKKKNHQAVNDKKCISGD